MKRVWKWRRRLGDDVIELLADGWPVSDGPTYDFIADALNEKEQRMAGEVDDLNPPCGESQASRELRDRGYVRINNPRRPLDTPPLDR